MESQFNRKAYNYYNKKRIAEIFGFRYPFFVISIISYFFFN